jgi:hypothetical protein
MAWLRELQCVTDAFVSSETATYLYDEENRVSLAFSSSVVGIVLFFLLSTRRYLMARLIPIVHVCNLQRNSGWLSTPVFASQSSLCCEERPRKKPTGGFNEDTWKFEIMPLSDPAFPALLVRRTPMA